MTVLNVYLSELPTLNLQQFVKCSSDFPAPALVPGGVVSAQRFVLQEVVILRICLSVSPILGQLLYPVTSLFSCT